MRQNRLCVPIYATLTGIQFETKQNALDNFPSAKSQANSKVNPAGRFTIRKMYMCFACTDVYVFYFSNKNTLLFERKNYDW